MSRAEALDRLDSLERLALANLPTPLVQAPRLAASLGREPGGTWIKMDAETGFALGGNKVRKLEYALAPDRVEGVTCLVTGGGPQSNHCRVTAAAAARLGLRCILVVNGPAGGPHRGNALLHRLFGAEVRTVPQRVDRASAMDDAAAEVEADGGSALVVPLGATTPRGALGYVAAAVELDRQLPADPEGAATRVVVPSSSCGTVAGLWAGFTLLQREDVRLHAVSADVAAPELASDAARIARGSLRLLGWEGPPADGMLEADDGQVGDGYGIPTEASSAALERFARAEGVVLDPVYTAKAAAGLVAAAADGRIAATDRVVFWHTGGHPALLA